MSHVAMCQAAKHLDVVDGGINDLLAVVARVVDVDALELCVQQLLGHVVHQ